ncbi:general secretion pathway protein [Roseobacter sp. HKCCD9010]|uniref:type II and III secretion system protein family protein n=1 Tax=unclassified Roseobacter TaxID=196798 RepID=UPI001492A443|nr:MULTISPECIES: type II and III secretion system protein family protein [unclassified Roseobacter]MBF9049142.1 general secretion pathway protein [Rhodobacterales bacterium HKCCD4356]NNV11142.1 general secretion pathway protein [Roseobacter sp. HKCCD7357]NNV15326.1 general secretion pathway protein [Roseobacter sp. HKCCD8768]NNV24786.1 general secretion pathway protein [Roseobacter sp. HKCCD8192]NNV29042.1 general secretion pathway protein [Roseobacter sp. HKCCD9061]
MSFMTVLRASLFGFALALAAAPLTQAQTLRVLEGATSTSLRVPMNRAVVVESDAIFAELSVANPAIADIATLSERTIYVLGRAPGRTTMTLLGVDGSLIANVEVQVIPDVAELRERLQDILPGEEVEVRTANDGIVLSGIVSSGQTVERAMELGERYAPGRVSNLMSVGGSQQVLLQVRFAEMSRSVRQNLSTSFGALRGDAQFGSGSAATNFPAAVINPTLDGRNGVFGVTFGSGSTEFGILLEALETNGLARTLAEPNLTALSGQTASFLAGGEYPIPVSTEEGVAIDFKPFGVNLSFTPTVVHDEVINLSLASEVSSIGEIQPGTNIPEINTRRASTTVEMRDGESFAIAGLLQDDFRDSIGQVPWLGDIPILGALFRSTNYQRDQTELVIIVTAHLVSPTRGEALALPTDRVAIPTERELFLGGRVSGAPRAGTATADVAQQDFSGSYGYVME